MITATLYYNPSPYGNPSGPVLSSTEDIVATLAIDNIACVERFIINDGVTDMLWTVRHNEPDSVQQLGPYYDDNPGNNWSCGNRIFALT